MSDDKTIRPGRNRPPRTPKADEPAQQPTEPQSSTPPQIIKAEERLREDSSGVLGELFVKDLARETDLADREFELLPKHKPLDLSKLLAGPDSRPSQLPPEIKEELEKVQGHVNHALTRPLTDMPPAKGEALGSDHPNADKFDLGGSPSTPPRRSKPPVR